MNIPINRRRRALAFLATVTIGAVVAASCAAPAHATPGAYTYGGNVRVTVAATSCATVTWPKGYTSSTCSFDQIVQGPIGPGDRFGAAIVSASGGVSCRVTDVTTGDLIYSDVASAGYTADCIRKATW